MWISFYISVEDFGHFQSGTEVAGYTVSFLSAIRIKAEVDKVVITKDKDFPNKEGHLRVKRKDIKDI